MDDTKLKKAVLLGIAAALFILLIWLIGKYVFICLLPFIIAYLISLAVRPASAAISQKFGVGKRFVSLFMVIILIAAIFLLLSWFTSLLVSEIGDAAQNISNLLSKEDNVIRRAVDYFSDLREKIPFLAKSADENLQDSIYDAIVSVVKDFLAGAASFAASLATAVIGKLPGFILTIVTAVISTFYICTDKGKLAEEAKEFIGSEHLASVRKIKMRINSALTSYFKSYLVLMLITFAELFLGFIILRIKNAFLLALVIALIDLLPVLGSGAVMIPWALSELIFTGNVKLGVGLLIMVAVMYIIRQFAEPKVVGGLMGIHPLLSLFSVYTGFVLFGVVGVLIFPILTHLIKAVASGVLKDKNNAKIPDAY